MQKSKSAIVVLVVFLAIAILLFISKLNSQKQSVSNNQTNQTVSNNQQNTPADNSQKTEPIPSDWKVYQNKDLGFQISYPSDWIEKDNIFGYDTKTANFVSSEGFNQVQANRKLLEEHYGASLEDSFFHFSEISIYRYNSIKEAWGKDTIDDLINGTDHLADKVGEINIDGVNATEAFLAGESTDYAILFEHNGYYYEIHLNSVKSKDSIPETQKQMISSFRFLS
jgi:hypothetical protein